MFWLIYHYITILSFVAICPVALAIHKGMKFTHFSFFFPLWSSKLNSPHSINKTLIMLYKQIPVPSLGELFQKLIIYYIPPSSLFLVFTLMPKTFAWYCTTTQKQPLEHNTILSVFHTRLQSRVDQALGSCQPGTATSCLVQPRPKTWALFLTHFIFQTAKVRNVTSITRHKRL